MRRRRAAAAAAGPRAGAGGGPAPGRDAAPEGAAALGLETVGDLLEHLPDRRLDRREGRTLASLAPGEEATVGVVVKGVATRPMRRRGGVRVEARVSDSSGPALAIWFGQPWVARQLEAGASVLLHGSLKRRNEFHVREWEHQTCGDDAAIHTRGHVPLYPAAEGITKRVLRELAWNARGAVHEAVEPLPAALRTAERPPGRQAALMAPTETLAEQHLATLDRLLGGLMPIALLTGATPAARRRALHGALASGELGLVVGTHALIEPSVRFRDLAVAVVDEEHRFGVRQREALDAHAPEGLSPHVLHLTATPIPRTLELTSYGDLDATALRELPAGRRPVETHVVSGERARARAYERAREEIARGRQCYVVCALVEESGALQARAATAETERLRATEFRGHRVALVHGQLPSREKAAAMAQFAAGEADVLVATSVIEVGIDVPNATVMLIEEAERYGLSQLHQLRGRVGRGEHGGLCVLFGDPHLPRLEAIARERDGFRLAEIDLELRGAGEVLGTRQHGLPRPRFAP